MLTNFCRLIVSLFLSVSVVVTSPAVLGGERNFALLEVSPNVQRYADEVVRPILDQYPNDNELEKLVRVAEILIDEGKGVAANRVEPGTFMRFHAQGGPGPGDDALVGLSNAQRQVVKRWHSQYMQYNPANVFFAPSADDVVSSRAAFGCSHHARSFVAIVKALSLVDNPQNLRYVVSSESEIYNAALSKQDTEMTINGHQFAMVKVGERWIAFDSSTAETVEMPGSFDPDNIRPPTNIPIHFKSYGDTRLLLRKIGRDYDDDLSDDSLVALMNISRSGEIHDSKFRWEEFVEKSTAPE